jgi:hypothetical protein
MISNIAFYIPNALHHYDCECKHVVAKTIRHYMSQLNF